MKNNNSDFKQESFSTSSGFFKWMLKSGGVLALSMPKGVLLLIVIGRALSHGSFFDVVFDFSIFLAVYYLFFLIISWKENQVKNNAPSISEKTTKKITIMVIIIGLMILL